MLRTLRDRAFSLRGPIIRALVFALAWAVLPFWLFLLVALYLFFVPLSQAGSVVMPFFALMVLTLLQPVGWPMAVIFGLIFWYILLIKEFYIVDRKSAYEALVLVLGYFLFRIFYANFDGGFGGGAAFFALPIAALVSLLFLSFMKNFGEEVSIVHNAGDSLRRVTGFAMFVVTFELLLLGLFLPLDFIYQSSIVFILAALFMEFTSKYLFYGTLSRRRVLMVSSVAFVLFALLLGSARWGL